MFWNFGGNYFRLILAVQIPFFSQNCVIHDGNAPLNGEVRHIVVTGSKNFLGLILPEFGYLISSCLQLFCQSSLHLMCI